MGKFFARLDETAEVAVTSPAVRASDTLRRFMKAAELDESTIEIAPQLYETDVRGVFTVLRHVPRSVESVLLVGHEPVLSASMSSLINGAELDFPTAGMARIEILVDWGDIGPGTGSLSWFVHPRLLQAVE